MNKAEQRANELYPKEKAYVGGISTIARNAYLKGHEEALGSAMNRQEYFEAIRKLDWLERISKDYHEHLDLMQREIDHYTIEVISYSARREGEYFSLNPHRSINPKYLLDGLREAVNEIDQEIEDLKESLSSVVVGL